MAKIAPIVKAQELSQDTPYVLRATLELIPSARNARTHTDRQIAKIAASIKRFKFLNPVIIDADNGIIAGHGRVLAAQKLGLETVPCILASHLTEAERRAYMLADNRIATESGWDKDLLAIELTELGDFGFDLAFTGFDQDEITDLTAPKNDGNGEDDSAPDVPVTPISKLGDVWLLGEHRVMCGDSTNAVDLGMMMRDDVADMVWTDPPYGVAYVGKTKDALKIQNDALTEKKLEEFIRTAFSAAGSFCKEGAVWYVAAPPGPLHHVFATVLLEMGIWRQTINWVKNTFALGRSDFHYRHEPIFYGWMPNGNHYFSGDRTLDTVWEFDKPSRNAEHPTMKPIDLIKRAVENSSKGQQIVLDIFGGSGSTLIACEKLGRKSRLMEIDPCYVDVIVRRWQDFTGKKATRESDGTEFDSLQPAV